MDQVTDVFQPLQVDDPPVVAGYRLAARLGAGGMGRVYLSHTPGGRPVAIKVVRPELADDPDFRRRFGREIQAARRVRGAYTAELIDADADGVPPWLAMLYVPGPWPAAGAGGAVADRGGGGGTARSSASSPVSSASPPQPRAEPHPLRWLDAKHPLSIKHPDAEPKKGEGDVRFRCASPGCELVSDTAAFVQVYGKPGDGTLDTCRLLLRAEKRRRLPLAGAANGTEICMQDSSGDIALFVIGTKSTAVPGIAFLQGDLTVWRAS